jgi:signal transduction histidine kinase
MRVQELVSDTLVRDAAISICSSRATTVSQSYDASATRSRNRLLIGVCNAVWMTLLLVGFIYFIIHGGYLKTVAVGSAAIIVGVAASPLRCRWKRAIASTHLSKTREIELVAAREAAEAALRTKSAFLSQMSHEIRTPMNAILGMADLLNDTVLSAEQHKYLSIMINNGGALLDRLTTSSILTASRPATSPSKPQVSTCPSWSSASPRLWRFAPTKRALSSPCELTPAYPRPWSGTRSVCGRS